jgi:hypothetical protein
MIATRGAVRKVAATQTRRTHSYEKSRAVSSVWSGAFVGDQEKFVQVSGSRVRSKKG